MVHKRICAGLSSAAVAVTVNGAALPVAPGSAGYVSVPAQYSGGHAVEIKVVWQPE